jgi:predicted nucleic acid-binding protein
MNGKTSLLLDTNVVIGFLNGDKAITHFFSTKASQKTFTVSQITRMELLGFPKINHDEEIIIQQFLSEVQIISLSDDIADKTIELRRITRLKLPDAIIVATALIHKFLLVTCDEQLINSIPDLLSTNPGKK